MNDLTVLERTVARVEVETRNYFNNTSFSKTLPQLQIAHDSSSIKAGKKCWRYYKYSIVDGWRAQGSDDTHLVFGHLLHSAAELYDHLRIGLGDKAPEVIVLLTEIGVSEDTILSAIDGLDHDTALLCVLRFCLIRTWDTENKCEWQSTEPTKTRKTLMRTLVWYLDETRNDRLKTVRLKNGRAAVEVSFRIYPNDMVDDNSFRAPTGEEYIFCGHIDKVVDFNDDLWIVDKKTTKYALDDNYFRQFSPDVQVMMYSLAGTGIFHKPVQGFIIDGIQVLVTGSRFRRKPIACSEEHLDEFILNMARYLRELEKCVAEDFWPMNEEACGWGNRQCQFRRICSTEPAGREDWLKTLYVKKPWDPLKPR